MLSAQDRNEDITGWITNSTGEPLYGITIQVEGTDKGTVTDLDGYFELTNPEPGTTVLIISGIGYVTERIEVGPAADREPIKIELQENTHRLGELVVHGKTEAGLKREEAFSISSISTREVQNTSGNLEEVLTTNPGIHIRKEGGLGSRFNLSLNGLSGRQIRFFLDGLPMENYGSSMSVNNIPVNLIERVEVYKGVVPVYLGGDALGGAVNLITRNTPRPYLDASYSTGSFNTHKIALDGQYTGTSSGFVLKANGFYNYSDNDYTIDVRIPDPDTGTYGEEQEVERFHDAYRSQMLKAETGFRGLSFADELLAGFSYSSNRDEVQHAMSMDRVFGRVHTRNSTTSGSLTYRKEFESLQVKAYASYLDNQAGVVDTSAVSYNWYGEFTPKNNQNIAESGWQKTLFRYNDRAFQGNANLTYLLTGRQKVVLNYTQSSLRREGSDPASRYPVAFENPNTLHKKVVSGSYQAKMFDERWNVTLFSKLYMFNSETEEVDWDGTRTSFTSDLIKPGYGLATTVRLSNALRIKSSFEKTYRFPDGYEMFGDGLLLLANPALEPETSNNINLGLLFDRIYGDHSVNAETNLFYRDATNLIRIEATGLTGQYVNQRDVISSGIEAGFRYEFKRLVFADLNVTYQNIVNNSRYENGRPSHIYGDRIPNIPYLMSSQSAGVKIDNLFRSDDRINLTWKSNFVEEFYLKWPSLGSADSKHIIPRQFVQHLQLGYSMNNERYNISLEAFNITDARAYDHFRMQKPGRSFQVKFRYLFTSTR